MKLTRRDLLAWGAGAAAGLIVTPVPWKVLDDTSKWSQNWPWIPQPARGPVDVKISHCTLCPNGCGLRVRMAAGNAVGVAGLSTHPASRGALCPLAFGAHQLNWHPQRLRSVVHHGAASSWNDAQAAFAKAASDGPVVIVDGFPGRASSAVLQSFAEKNRGEYRVVLGPESRALQPYEAWTGTPESSLGYDLDNSRTIVSFGAPLLDGWGVPGRFTRLWSEKAAGSNDPQLRLIQIDSSLTRTAARAWQWIQIRQGSATALASGLARVLLQQNLVPAHAPIPPMTLSEAASQTGLATDAIENLARTIAARTPVVAIAADENPEVAALNVLLGAIGTRGGIVRRTKESRAYVDADSPISNARAVLIDASVPWDFTPPTDAEVFRFAAWNGGPTKADWLLPAPGFLEEQTDIPTPPTFASETYAIAPALLKPASDVRSAARFVAATDSTLLPADKIIHTRCQEIFRKRSGALQGAVTTPLTAIATADKLEEELTKGAVWIGEPSPPGHLRCELKEWPNASTLERGENWAEQWPVLPPLASKLYIESTLRQAPDRRNA